MVVDARVAASVLRIDGINTSSTSENNIGTASSVRDFSSRITQGCHLLRSGSQSKQVFSKRAKPAVLRRLDIISRRSIIVHKR